MNWETILKEEREKPYFKSLTTALSSVAEFYPDKQNVYRALKTVPFDKVKVVIVGQDCYHGGQANGLAFAVNNEFPIPPSLRNIFKEIHSEYGEEPKSRNLEGWAKQGVLLLNTILTVEPHKPLSHKDLGWQVFTDRLISELGGDSRPKVFILWGGHARSKKQLISAPNLVLEAPHPSPFSAYTGFFGCGHFKQTNEFLERNGIEKINWIES